MKKIIKRIVLLGSFILIMCFTAACGNDEAEAQLESVEDRAMEQQLETKDSMNKMNEDTKKLEQDSNDIEQE